MLQGMARGKVGDIVFSRLNGEQISRVRNRNPKNPRTNAQLYQRAIMATVMQAYSAGKEIFDHSFQGKSVGAANQRRFMSLNAKKLRDQIADDLTKEYTEEQIARVVAPGSITPVPTVLVVSEGTYTQNLFVYSEENGGGNWMLKDKLNNETVAAYATRNGLISGDIYTFVAIYYENPKEVVFSIESIESDFAKQYRAKFGFVRMTVKTDLSSTAELSSISQLFDIETDGQFTGNALGIGVLNAFAAVDGMSAIIRSRKDEDLRSTSEMKHDYSTGNEINAGIAPAYLIPVWKTGTVTLGNSDLILEGGGDDITIIDSNPGSGD